MDRIGESSAGGIPIWGLVASLAAPLLGAAPVRAEDSAPVVVVVETADPAVSAVELRSAIARRGVPALSLSDDAAPTAEGTLTVVVPAVGPVRMRFTDTEGRTHTRDQSVGPGERAAVLARLAVRLMRDSRRGEARGAREVLDPWRDESVAVHGDLSSRADVLDPWGGAPSRRPVRYSEVLDPWAHLPRPDDDAPAVSLVAPEVLDPWAREDARHLDAPRR